MRALLLAGAALLLAGDFAGAVIARAYPLREVIEGADTIAECRVAAPGGKGRSPKLELAAALKGQPAWKALTVRLTGGGDPTQAPVLSRRLQAGRTVLLFSKAKRFTLGYVEGTWFRLAAPSRPGAPWRFVHLEPYLRRTYRGTNAQLRAVITEVLAGKARAPEPDPSAKPGYGP